MTDQQAREFLERLAVPNPTGPPPCPLCHSRHQLEQQCASRAVAFGGAMLGYDAALGVARR